MTETEPATVPSYIQPIADLFRPGCTALWATTFNMELELFNEYLLGRLGDPPLNAVVICDQDRLDRALDAIPPERLTLLNPTNRRYLLRGVRLGSGRFHPKSYLAVAGRSALLLVGSGNLSSHGIDLGREVFTAFRSGEPIGDAAIGIWRDWMRQIVARVDDTMLAARFADLESRLPEPPPVAAVVEPPLLHNLRRPLLDQFIQRVGEGPVDELIVTAPFYDSTGDALGQLAARLRPSTIRLYFTSTTSVDGNALSQRLKDTGATLETFAYQPDRFTHAKLIAVTQGNRGMVLSGSANLSRAALTLNSGTGNTELAVITALAAQSIYHLFLPPDVSAAPKDLASLDELTFDEPPEQDQPLPVRLMRATAGRDNRVFVDTEPALQPGWYLADHEAHRLLLAAEEGSFTDGPMTGPLVRVADSAGNALSGPAVIDDPAALERALRKGDEQPGSHHPPELTDTDLTTPLGAALLLLHQRLIMDLNERPSSGTGGGLTSGEAGAESDDTLWERLERETLQRDPRVGTYERLIRRGQPGTPIAEQIIELLEAMRARVPADVINDPTSLLRLINRARSDRDGQGNGYSWSITSRVRIRTRNVLRRWAAAQTDPRLEWVNPLAPLLNLVVVAAMFARLWHAQAEEGAIIELEVEDLDDLWARWFQPFIGTCNGDGWVDKSELRDDELSDLAGPSLAENATLLCWLAIRPGPDRRDRIISWQSTVRAALTHNLINDSAEVSSAASAIVGRVVETHQIGDDLQMAVEFIDDSLWCARTAETLGVDSLEIASLRTDQEIQVVLHVAGIADGLTDSRVPSLIAGIRQYRNVDRVAIYSDDHLWRLGVITGQPGWYVPSPGAPVADSPPLAVGAIEALISGSEVLANLFGPAAKVA